MQSTSWFLFPCCRSQSSSERFLSATSPTWRSMRAQGIHYCTFLRNSPKQVVQKRTLTMASNGKRGLGMQLISSAAQRPRCQLGDLLDLYFGLSCNRYKELRSSGFPSEPVAGEARILIPALLVHSTSILAPSEIYLSIHPSIRQSICPSLPLC